MSAKETNFNQPTGQEELMLCIFWNTNFTMIPQQRQLEMVCYLLPSFQS
jgi:hypothetical protein